MNDLFLIAHRVRGEPALDIAIRCDDIATETSPAPWWIIPTSGHRAYPYWFTAIKPLLFVERSYNSTVQAGDAVVVPPMPEDWPDHYSANDRRNRITNTISNEGLNVEDSRKLLEELGL